MYIRFPIYFPYPMLTFTNRDNERKLNCMVSLKSDKNLYKEGLAHVARKRDGASRKKREILSMCLKDLLVAMKNIQK